MPDPPQTASGHSWGLVRAEGSTTGSPYSLQSEEVAAIGGHDK